MQVGYQVPESFLHTSKKVMLPCKLKATGYRIRKVPVPEIMLGIPNAYRYAFKYLGR